MDETFKIVQYEAKCHNIERSVIFALIPDICKTFPVKLQ